MSEADPETSTLAGISTGDPVDVVALFDALREEVRRSGADRGARTVTLQTGVPRETKQSGFGRCRPTARFDCAPGCAAVSGLR